MGRRIDVAERRARLGQRHRLAATARAGTPIQVADSLVALHSTDPSSVYLSALIRMTGGDLRTVEHALYEDRTLIRLLGMRRTVFVASLEVAPLIQAACSRGVAAKERRKLIAMLTETGVGDDVEGWLAEVSDVALQALLARGSATAAELAGDDPRLRTQIVLARGKDYEGRQNVVSRLMLLLGAEGRVVRGRPRGTWASHQHSWSPTTSWTPDGLDQWSTPDAEVELSRRWLAAYGPARPQDLQWWTGWTKTQVKRALAEIRPAEVELDTGPGVVLADDLDAPPGTEPWAALLPALDPTPMGWQQRHWYLGEHGPKLFDNVGNIGPSLWWDGRIVGGWAQDSGGDIVCRFLEDIGSDAEAAVEVAAARMTELLEGHRLTARTRRKTWLEQELTA
ncbi:winged helix DNA-binding domain-containing protein [Kibdelosporangium phytohabitans]|uniref:Winged helix DNA-binding domain-containing protein n=1 Tax=Kibdelosporangium phytohabitans TaxID=860235 RepID=A0A0N7F3S9_9PSEU|nr:winged helix DNA-binding domain-containing protein [Kibdelosporangium phytohabitans]ALG09479.1 hypothetical protein AOZ06_23510 [Kibdelosporangium phytohabitans]MBE1469225.1 hypothetical protein [Kibdelosporangium phytohabitans]